MDDLKRGTDAGDDAPQLHKDGEHKRPADQQDAPNYKDRTDGGQALRPEDVSSANDE